MKPLVIPIALLFCLLLAASALATEAASAVVPGRAFVRVGSEYQASVQLTGEGVGSYTADLRWNPAVLRFKSYSGAPPAGFAGFVNASHAADGWLRFNGANPYGSGPETTLITVTFDVVRFGFSPIDVDYSAMAAAGTFENLLPSLAVQDGAVWAWGRMRIIR
jgi:hypothetical protein